MPALSTPHAPFTDRTTAGAAEAPGGHLKFRPDIEGLRAVAILLVVLYHAGWRYATGGYLGVDVFFVLSGFLISGIIIDEVAKTGRVSLANFWARRARRLLPAATLITLVVLATNVIMLSPLDQGPRAATAQAFAAYGSNVLFAIRSTDYFGGQATRDQLLHSWSLSVEEQFYLFFAPALLLLAVATRTGATAFRRRLAIGVIGLSLASLAACLVFVRTFPVIAFFSLPFRAWEFGLGALSALVVKRMVNVNRGLLEIVAVASAAGLAVSAVFFGETRVQPLGPTTLVPTLATVGLILSGAGARQTLVARALSLSPARLIGRLSYSWYLWHWPVLVYLREVRPASSTRFAVLVAMASLVPAALTYWLVESPIRFSPLLQRRTRATLIGAVAVSVLTLLAGLGASRYAAATLASPRYASLLSATERASTYDNGCQLPLLVTVSPPCTFGAAGSDTTIVLFGDSHSAHWFPAFDSVATMRRWRFVNLTKTGCPSIDLTLDNTNLGRRYTECETWRKAAIARIDSLHPTIVVLANMRSYNVVFGTLRPHTDSSALARRTWGEALGRTLRRLAPVAQRVVVLEDTPQLGVDVPRCLVRFIDTPTKCDAPATRALDPHMVSVEEAAVAAVPRTARISLNTMICDQGICPAMRNGMVRYRDRDHLAVRYVQSLAPALSDALTDALHSSPR